MSYFEIDISKDVFDVMDSAGNHYQFENNFKGYKAFKRVLKSLKKSLKNIQTEIKLLEIALTNNVKSEHQEMLTLLESIPGLGRKTSIMLIVLTDGFERFEKTSELFICRFNAYN